jgi:hypothetical protein
VSFVLFVVLITIPMPPVLRGSLPKIVPRIALAHLRVQGQDIAYNSSDYVLGEIVDGHASIGFDIYSLFHIPDWGDLTYNWMRFDYDAYAPVAVSVGVLLLILGSAYRRLLRLRVR